MPIDLNKLWVYRMIHHLNLEYILEHGVYYRNNPNHPVNYINIGNPEIINSRDQKPVSCYPGTMINAFVPFYFAVRTPMLYNIHTSYGVNGHAQHEIIYLCCNVNQIAGSNLQWCFTDGNAATRISKFFNNMADLEGLDWHSIRTTDFRDNNEDGDPDRKRKKHAEFLIKDHLPIEFIKSIVVYNQAKHDSVLALVNQYNRNITVHINPNHNFYF